MSHIASPIGKGLGRVGHFDPRNVKHLIADRVGHDSEARALALVGRAAAATPEARADRAQNGKYHWHARTLDQGDTPRCTSFGGLGLAADGPVTRLDVLDRLESPDADTFATAFYDEIVTIDRAAGRVFNGGATMLALAQAGQARGYWGEYLWGYTVADFIRGIRVGPVLLGLPWLGAMFSPDRKHATIRAFGPEAGGHCITATGADFDDGMARLSNSWGSAWGHNGQCYLPFEDLERLLAAGGEILMVRELPKATA